ncbi:collagen, type I, alpha 1a-like [Loxodonta africana]|uniref:collagen, type I, alpha 1a-like n=1 Tax=Loxodonta africana TaxID=9785 RepID=UPI0030D4B624
MLLSAGVPGARPGHGRRGRRGRLCSRSRRAGAAGRRAGGRARGGGAGRAWGRAIRLQRRARGAAGRARGAWGVRRQRWRGRGEGSRAAAVMMVAVAALSGARAASDSASHRGPRAEVTGFSRDAGVARAAVVRYPRVLPREAETFARRVAPSPSPSRCRALSLSLSLSLLSPPPALTRAPPGAGARAGGPSASFVCRPAPAAAGRCFLGSGRRPAAPWVPRAQPPLRLLRAPLAELVGGAGRHWAAGGLEAARSAERQALWAAAGAEATHSAAAGRAAPPSTPAPPGPRPSGRPPPRSLNAGGGAEGGPPAAPAPARPDGGRVPGATAGAGGGAERGAGPGRQVPSAEKCSAGPGPPSGAHCWQAGTRGRCGAAACNGPHPPARPARSFHARAQPGHPLPLAPARALPARWLPSSGAAARMSPAAASPAAATPLPHSPRPAGGCELPAGPGGLPGWGNPPPPWTRPAPFLCSRIFSLPIPRSPARLGSRSRERAQREVRDAVSALAGRRLERAGGKWQIPHRPRRGLRWVLVVSATNLTLASASRPPPTGTRGVGVPRFGEKDKKAPREPPDACNTSGRPRVVRVRGRGEFRGRPCGGDRGKPGRPKPLRGSRFGRALQATGTAISVRWNLLGPGRPPSSLRPREAADQRRNAVAGGQGGGGPSVSGTPLRSEGANAPAPPRVAPGSVRGRPGGLRGKDRRGSEAPRCPESPFWASLGAPFAPRPRVLRGRSGREGRFPAPPRDRAPESPRPPWSNPTLNQGRPLWSGRPRSRDALGDEGTDPRPLHVWPRGPQVTPLGAGVGGERTEERQAGAPSACDSSWDANTKLAPGPQAGLAF